MKISYISTFLTFSAIATATAANNPAPQPTYTALQYRQPVKNPTHSYKTQLATACGSTPPASTASSSNTAAQEEQRKQSTQQASRPTTPSGKEHYGKMSFHPFDGALGSCGKTIANTDFAVAMDARTFGASTYDRMTGAPLNPWCGKTITIVNGAKSTQAKVMDLCAGCKSAQGLDLSFAVWDELVDSRDAGVVDMKWYA